MSAVGTKCSIVLPKLQHDAKGNEWKNVSDQAANDALRKVPGVNAIFTSDNQWAISWDKGAFTSKTSKIPAVVVTYAGTESPLGEKIQELTALTQGEDASGSSLAQLSDEKKQTNYLGSKETWVVLHDIGNPTLFFDRVLPASRTGPVSDRRSKASLSCASRLLRRVWPRRTT
jgi:hypothetical protein